MRRIKSLRLYAKNSSNSVTQSMRKIKSLRFYATFHQGSGGLGTVTDLLLRQAQAGRAGAQGDYDYDVIGADGVVIGRIFKATSSPAGTPWMWSLAYGDHEDQTLTHGYEATRQAAMQAFADSWNRET